MPSKEAKGPRSKTRKSKELTLLSLNSPFPHLSPPDNALLHLLTGFPHLPSIHSQLLLPPGASRGSGDLCRSCTLQHLPVSMRDFCSPLHSPTVLTMALLDCIKYVSPYRIPPSKLCGPFRGKLSIWAQIPESIESLPQSAQNFLYFLGTQAFTVPLLIFSR